jgi:uncharacterized protein (TIGR02996 family)
MLESLRDDVCSKLERGDAHGAFDLLLARWREDRTAELAVLCQKLSERVAQDAAPLGGKTQADQLVAWTNAFRETSPLGLGRLLPGLEANLTHPRFAFPRADAISTVKDDPRVSDVMLRVLQSVKGGSAWQKVVLRCFRAVEASSDPRSIEALELLLSEKGKRLAVDFSVKEFALERGAKVLDALRARMPERSAVDPKDERALQDVSRAIETLGKVDVPLRVARPKGDPAELVARIWEHPDDNELRLVLADALSEAGDPRGELITLQMARSEGKADRKMLARERALLKEHARTFLGPLAAVVSLKSAVFERGFLERCEAYANAMAARLQFDHTEWATVQSVTFTGKGSRISPAMRTLKEARGVELKGLKHLLETGHPTLERLELSAQSAFSRYVTIARSLEESAALPALHHLKLHIDDTGASDWLWDAPWSSQLRSLAVVVGWIENDGGLSHWAQVFGERAHLERLQLFVRHKDVYATLTRSGSNVVLTVEASEQRSHVGVSDAIVRLLRQFTSSPNIDVVAVDIHSELAANDRRQITAAAQQLGRVRDVTFAHQRAEEG